MMVSPLAAICLACGQRAVSAISSIPEEDVGVDAPWQRLDDSSLLEQLPRVAHAADMVEEHLKIWVDEARRRGITWAAIGEALGMTRQSAWERFSMSKSGSKPRREARHP